MVIRDNVPLASLTTLKAGGPARRVAECENDEDVRAALEVAKQDGVPFYVLGQGSNVLASDEGFSGMIIRVQSRGFSFTDDGDTVILESVAGEGWDALVHEAATRGLWGIENLAGIPGTIGAAPVQNIGAYGTDISQTLHSVDVLDAATLTTHTFSVDECGLSYRDSRFKHEPNLIILRVRLRLMHAGQPQLTYSDLARAKDAGADLSTPALIGDAVRAVRAKKFPNLAEFGTAGSFFKNPIVAKEIYDGLVAKLGSVPQFPQADGRVKIPLAFLLDKMLGLRGYRKGPAFLFGEQPLVLVLEPGGKAGDIESLAQFVEQQVQEKIGITIEREVRTLAY